MPTTRTVSERKFQSVGRGLVCLAARLDCVLQGLFIGVKK